MALRASVETVADLLAFLPVFFITDESNVQDIERFGMPPAPLVELSELDPQKMRNSSGSVGIALNVGEKSTNVYVEHQASIETTATEPKRPKPRGFAAMDPVKVSEIARKGGKAAHAAGTAHEFSPDEARVAGKKGGLAPHSRRGTQKAASDSSKATTDGA